MGAALAPRGAGGAAAQRSAARRGARSACATQRLALCAVAARSRPAPPAGRVSAPPGRAAPLICVAARVRGVAASAAPRRSGERGADRRSADAADVTDAVLQGAEAVCLLGALGLLVRALRARRGRPRPRRGPKKRAPPRLGVWPKPHERNARPRL